MGLTVLALEVANPADRDRREAVDVLIDSGAICCRPPWSSAARFTLA
jgi:hypothetical protein